MFNFTLRYDRDVDALYLKLRDGVIAETIEYSENILVDVDAEGRTLAMEVLDASQVGLVSSSAEISVPERITDRGAMSAD